MNSKSIIWIFMTIGSMIGSYIPSLWGDDSFLSFSGIFFSSVGAIVGIWFGFNISRD
jgi:uncharacterized membrane protein YeaQ/YmgE (transglycosylase-associated protein family)